MPQQFLHRADVGARLQQVGGEGVAQGVNRDVFGDAGLSHRFFQLAIQSFFEQMMAALDACLRVYGQFGRWKHPESGPTFARSGVFALERVGQKYAAASCGPVLPPKCARVGQLRPQIGRQSLGQHDHPVLVALATADHDGMAVKVMSLMRRPNASRRRKPLP